MQTLTRLILHLWGVLFPTRARAARGQAGMTPESASPRPSSCRLVPRRSIGDLSRSASSPRARRSSAVGQSKNSSDPDDIAFCAWMYYLN